MAMAFGRAEAYTAEFQPFKMMFLENEEAKVGGKFE